jgi:hypothetical protein
LKFEHAIVETDHPGHVSRSGAHLSLPTQVVNDKGRYRPANDRKAASTQLFPAGAEVRICIVQD